tara:strand:+ start:193 stop:420 length:228 start_codon:yes stop_codon:yes gene_type:complete
MNLSTITKNILLNIREEIENEENMDIIKKDILKPLIKHIIDELYPYLLKMMIIIIVILFFLFITIFLNLKVIYKD